MFWFVLALISALCLGFYDALRKYALRDNAVLPVLMVSTLTSSVILLPLALASGSGALSSESWAYVAPISLHQHLLLVAKAAIVLTSWVFVYYGMKHLPLSIVAPIRATAPIWTLIGALIIFAERPNGLQWLGLVVTFAFFFLFSVAGKMEGINFRANKWVWSVVLGTLVGAGSALFDKYIIREADIPRMSVLFYYSCYQFVMTIPLLFMIWWPNRKSEPFHFGWAMPMIGIIIIAADFFYYGALNNPDSMISLISPIRRCNSIVSFLLAACIFHEHNMLRKGLCLLGILAGVGIIIWGSL
ncbi:MAG: EamA family transporter [Marinilabiliaceae bacterium]|nr:DMT family transporter [Bacteroidales bacterium]MDY4520941.1 DMT family transporter [Bacteroidales bacterium]